MSGIEYNIGIFLIWEYVFVFTSAYTLPSENGLFRTEASGAHVTDHAAEHTVI